VKIFKNIELPVGINDLKTNCIFIDRWLEPTKILLEPARYGWSRLEPSGAVWSQPSGSRRLQPELELELELEPDLCRLT
jgi:hypothetical protein